MSETITHVQNVAEIYCHNLFLLDDMFRAGEGENADEKREHMRPAGRIIHYKKGLLFTKSSPFLFDRKICQLSGEDHFTMVPADGAVAGRSIFGITLPTLPSSMSFTATTKSLLCQPITRMTLLSPA